MRKITILKIESLSREPLVVEGFLFEGSDPDAESVAVVGAMEGKTILPLYTASQLVSFLKKNESKIRGTILVIPSINHYALNINERFWPLDKTNINVMFPGYERGETTQRIAKKLFDVLQEYDHSVLLETRDDLSTCTPYIKLFQSGFEDIDNAKKFGFRFIHHKELSPIDTVSLQYNLQLWESKAYSIICPHLEQIESGHSNIILEGIINFLSSNELIAYRFFGGVQNASLITRDDTDTVKVKKSGIFVPLKGNGSYVNQDELIGKILDSLQGDNIAELRAPHNGMIVCSYKNALILEHAVAFRIARSG